MKILSRRLLLLLAVGFLLSISLFFPSRSLAQNIPPNPNDIYDLSDPENYHLQKEAADECATNSKKPCVDGINVNKFQNEASANWLLNGLGCTHRDPEKCDPNTALNGISIMTASLFAVPPASGIYYAQDLLQNAGILAKPVYAQGFGFAGLAPILPIWKVTRNIAYTVIIIVMIVIGFMVIFRMKIDPKTVISVQAALPRIVLALLLITLSYAIVGFLVDLMYVSMAMIIGILSEGMGNTATQTALTQTYFLTADWGDLFKTVMGGGFSAVEDFIIKNSAAYGVGSAGVMVALKVLASSMRFGWIGFWGASLLGIIILLIISLGLLFTFIRIFMLLLNSYIQLLVAVILGPFQLLMGAIPGKTAFTDWIMNVIANLVVFPATVAILMFGEYLTTLNSNTGELFSPPLIGVPGKAAFPAFMGLGVLFLAPTLITQIKKAFNPKPILPISAGTAFAPLAGAAQTGMGAASQFYYMQNMPVIGKWLGGGKEHRQA